MTHQQPLMLQAQLAYDAALNSPCPDWRTIAELLRSALRTAATRKALKAPKVNGGFPKWPGRLAGCPGRA